MGQANCIYIDAEKKWWTAKVDGDLVIGKKDILLIKEETEELKEAFKEDFVEYINSIAPHILFVDEKDTWHGTDPRDRNVVYPN